VIVIKFLIFIANGWLLVDLVLELGDGEPPTKAKESQPDSRFLILYEE
jgi:hypothetical protein